MNESTTDRRIVPTPTGQAVLTEVLRDGARRMLAQAVEAEVAARIADHAHLKDEAGHQQVARDGHPPERTIPTGLGPIEVQQPRVRDRRPAGQREALTSAILPPSPRETRSPEELIPRLSLKGVSTGDFAEALRALPGPEAPGLSATTSTWPRPRRRPGRRSTRPRHRRHRCHRPNSCRSTGSVGARTERMSSRCGSTRSAAGAPSYRPRWTWRPGSRP